jgi:hypothetical protein
VILSRSGGLDMKPRANHRMYFQALRRMPPDDRLRRAFELSDLCRMPFLRGADSMLRDVSGNSSAGFAWGTGAHEKARPPLPRIRIPRSRDSDDLADHLLPMVPSGAAQRSIGHRQTVR